MCPSFANWAHRNRCVSLNQWNYTSRKVFTAGSTHAAQQLDHRHWSHTTFGTRLFTRLLKLRHGMWCRTRGHLGTIAFSVFLCCNLSLCSHCLFRSHPYYSSRYCCCGWTLSSWCASTCWPPCHQSRHLWRSGFIQFISGIAGLAQGSVRCKEWGHNSCLN